MLTVKEKKNTRRWHREEISWRGHGRYICCGALHCGMQCTFKYRHQRALTAAPWNLEPAWNQPGTGGRKGRHHRLPVLPLLLSTTP